MGKTKCASIPAEGQKKKILGGKFVLPEERLKSFFYRKTCEDFFFLKKYIPYMLGNKHIPYICGII